MTEKLRRLQVVSASSDFILGQEHGYVCVPGDSQNGDGYATIGVWLANTTKRK